VFKQATGKLALSGGTHQFVAELIEDGVRTLDATVEHMLRMAPCRRGTATGSIGSGGAGPSGGIDARQRGLTRGRL